MPALRELQRLFWQALADGTPPPALLARVEGTTRLAPPARVGIYADAYLWRITDALAEDFPRLAAHVGGPAFLALVRAYLGRHPSRHPSIGRVGGRLADFLAEGAGGDLPPWAADLARLEWTRRGVFEAPDAVPLTVEALRRVPAERWGALRLALVPGAATLVTAWPAHVPWAEEPLAALAPARTAYRVWRQGYVVHHAVMDAAEEEALGRLAAGEALAAVCDTLASGEEAARFLLRWVEDGLLATGDPHPRAHS